MVEDLQGLDLGVILNLVLYKDLQRPFPIKNSAFSVMLTLTFFILGFTSSAFSFELPRVMT